MVIPSPTCTYKNISRTGKKYNALEITADEGCAEIDGHLKNPLAMGNRLSAWLK